MLQNITLAKWIDFCEKSEPIDKEFIVLNESSVLSESKKSILLSGLYVRKAFLAFDTLGRIELGEFEKGKEPVVFVLKWYENFNSILSRFLATLKDESRFSSIRKATGLPDWKLNAINPIVFGQFIDSKMISQSGMNDWKTLQYIASIYINTEKYDDLYTNEESKKFIDCAEITLDKVFVLRIWWEKINSFINENFTVFQDSGDVVKDSENIDEHMKRWGWVNFLKNLAKTKIFDIPGNGMNSIECVRATKCHEVLIFASEEKDYNIASYRDIKNAYKE